jgi:hypothetical protein
VPPSSILSPPLPLLCLRLHICIRLKQNTAAVGSCQSHLEPTRNALDKTAQTPRETFPPPN